MTDERDKYLLDRQQIASSLDSGDSGGFHKLDVPVIIAPASLEGNALWALRSFGALSSEYFDGQFIGADVLDALVADGRVERKYHEGVAWYRLCLDARLEMVVEHVRKTTTVDDGPFLVGALEEARELLKANMTPGWICECGIFTGILKGATACRGCGKPRKG